jgi:hypothetical protein
VSLNFAGWNQLDGWLRQVERLVSGLTRVSIVVTAFTTRRGGTANMRSERSQTTEESCGPECGALMSWRRGLCIR